MNPLFSFQKQPHLTLVGAGPGDPELITVKGIKALHAADIVLYDALVSQQILDLIPAGTPMQCVGKRLGEHSFAQDDINELIVEFAHVYGHVVRLKGGDPYVFGRATEEISFAAKHGIATSVVSGISSALAVPAALDIPLTARGLSESFWVVTGTTMKGAISTDIKLAAQSTATVIILMGLHKIHEIMSIFIAHGKSDTPVAVIQNGTLSNQRSVVGTVSSIVFAVEQDKITSPAIIVVGEVVRYARDLEQVIAKHNQQL